MAITRFFKKKEKNQDHMVAAAATATTTTATTTTPATVTPSAAPPAPATATTTTPATAAPAVDAMIGLQSPQKDQKRPGGPMKSGPSPAKKALKDNLEDIVSKMKGHSPTKRPGSPIHQESGVSPSKRLPVVRSLYPQLDKEFPPSSPGDPNPEMVEGSQSGSEEDSGSLSGSEDGSKGNSEPGSKKSSRAGSDRSFSGSQDGSERNSESSRPGSKDGSQKGSKKQHRSGFLPPKNKNRPEKLHISRKYTFEDISLTYLDAFGIHIPPEANTKENIERYNAIQDFMDKIPKEEIQSIIEYVGGGPFLLFEGAESRFSKAMFVMLNIVLDQVCIDNCRDINIEELNVKQYRDLQATLDERLTHFYKWIIKVMPEFVPPEQKECIYNELHMRHETTWQLMAKNDFRIQGGRTGYTPTLFESNPSFDFFDALSISVYGLPHRGPELKFRTIWSHISLCPTEQAMDERSHLVHLDYVRAIGQVFQLEYLATMNQEEDLVKSMWHIVTAADILKAGISVTVAKKHVTEKPEHFHFVHKLHLPSAGVDPDKLVYNVIMTRRERTEGPWRASEWENSWCALLRRKASPPPPPIQHEHILYHLATDERAYLDGVWHPQRQKHATRDAEQKRWKHIQLGAGKYPGHYFIQLPPGDVDFQDALVRLKAYSGLKDPGE